MSDLARSDEPAEASTTNTATANGVDSHDQNDDHDCKDHLEYVEFEWVDPTYDDILVCEICDSEYRVVFARAFLLDGEDFSLVEEYTDSIEKELRRLRDDQDEGTDEEEAES